MFAPIGYIPLAEVHYFLHSARSEMGSVSEALNALSPADGSPPPQWQINLNLDAIEMFPFWAVWWLCTSPHFPTYLCSPAGQILRISHSFFMFADDGISSIDRFFFPVLEGDDVDRVIENMRNHVMTDDEELQFDNCFTVSLETGCVRSLEEMRAALVEYDITEELADKRQVQQLLIALEAAGGPKKNGKPLKISPVVEEPLEKRVHDEFFISASRFTGWSVCFSENDIPSGAGDLLSLVPFTRNLERAVIVNEASPEEIVQKIVEMYDSGIPVVRDAVRRTLATGMKVEQWRTIWKEATLLRPSLSRRGPKRPKQGYL